VSSFTIAHWSVNDKLEIIEESARSVYFPIRSNRRQRFPRKNNIEYKGESQLFCDANPNIFLDFWGSGITITNAARIIDFPYSWV